MKRTPNNNLLNLGERLIFRYTERLRRAVAPYLSDPFLFQEDMGKTAAIKEHEYSNQYRIDVKAQNLFEDVLEECDIDGHVFSEETGWTKVGHNPNCYIICDPFDNTFLATRSVNLAATSICVTDLAYKFVCCAIADLTNGITYYANPQGVFALSGHSVKTKKKRPISVADTRSLEHAFIALPTMQPTRRDDLNNGIYRHAWYWLNASGAIFIGKLASGFIDAYSDPFLGQPLYEIACLEMVKLAGGTVTDIEGGKFNLASIIKSLEINKKQRYKFVASCTRELHDSILKTLQI